MTVKFNMSKAYDRVEWLYLNPKIKDLGCCSKWIDLIMSRITKINYFILVNGKLGATSVPLPILILCGRSELNDFQCRKKG